jgi:sec-independent protein translocase protein TatA
MPNIGPLELVIVLGIVILILGPKRIPEAARSLGRGMRNFKAEIGGEKRKDKEKYEELSDPEKPAGQGKSETKV